MLNSTTNRSTRIIDIYRGGGQNQNNLHFVSNEQMEICILEVYFFMGFFNIV